MAQKIGKTLLTWDESITEETEFRLAEQEESVQQGIISESEKQTAEQIEQAIWEDEDFWRLRWEDMTESLTSILQRKNSGGYWKAEVRNFGWRSLSGSKFLKADDGAKFLQEILPNTDCHFTVFNYGRGLAIQNFHHDSPMANEWYYVLPTTERTYSES